MKNTLLTLSLLCITMLSTESIAVDAVEPDTRSNRYATVEDAEFWPSVEEGDYIIFKANWDNGHSIYALASDRSIRIELPVGKKIHIWRGDYYRIYIDGRYCENTLEQPTVITNLGGQVRWGDSPERNTNRGFELDNFAHAHISGKYDMIKQTGDPQFLGHDEGRAYGSGDYYERYGFWGSPRWTEVLHGSGTHNILSAYRFSSIKIDYVSVMGGGFAGFNLKTDNPQGAKRVVVDVQDCFAGFIGSEAFYVGWSTGANNQDWIHLTLRNNVVVFSGSEGFQTDNISADSIIENNVVLFSAQMYRRPFQAIYHDNLHQFSMMEGGVTIRSNIMAGCYGNLHNLRHWNVSGSRPVYPSADKPLLLENNYYGYATGGIGYIWEGNGVTPYIFRNNVYGPVADVVNEIETETYSGGFLFIGNTLNPFILEDNIYPTGKSLYRFSGNGSNITNTDNVRISAPLLRFENLGFPDEFDFRKSSFWTARYVNSGTSKDNSFVPYRQGDVVYYYDTEGSMKFFECIQDHQGEYNPYVSPEQWRHVTWNGRDLPPLDVRLKADSYYSEREMGLTYNSCCEASGSWSGYEIVSGNYVDTDEWMGWLYLLPGNEWIYSFFLSKWLYFPAEADSSGAWAMLKRHTQISSDPL